MSDTGRREQDLRRLYDAFVSGDFSAIELDLHPEIEWVNPAEAVEPGTHVGREAFVDVLGKLHDTFDYESLEIQEAIDRGDQTVTVVRFIAKGQDSGVPVDGQFAHLLGWEDDRLRRLEWFRNRGEALAALDR